MRDGTVDLGLDDVGSQIGLIVPRAVHPALRTEIVAEFCHISAASSMIAPIDHSPVVVPQEDRLEERFLFERYHHVVEIEANLRCTRADVGKEGRQFRDHVVPLTFLELVGEPAVPEILPDSEFQFVREKEIERLARLTGQFVLKSLEKLLDDLRTRSGIERINGFHLYL